MKKFTRLLIAFFLIISQTQAQNNALHFDGSDNVTINHGSTALSGTFTIEFWAKPSALGPDGFLGSRSPSDASLDIQLTASGGLHGDIGDGSAWLTNTADASGAGLQVGVWSHIAYVITPTGYTIYVNGVQKATGSFSGTPLAFDGNHTMILGAVNAGGSQPYNGALDELRIWSTARTQTEIQNNMNLELSSGTGLVAAYHFNQGTAGGDNTGMGGITTLTDATGTFDGTLNGFTLMGSTSNFVIGFTALPVELTAFTATSLEKSVLLTWQTASELNNEGFEIQKAVGNAALEAGRWEALAFVAGNGTTNEIQNYSYTDERPQAGTNYYRLKQIDFDGKFEYSDIVSVQFAVGSPQLEVFPNPVRADELTLYLPESNPEVSGEKTTIRLYDQMGKLALQQTTFSQQQTLNVSQLPAGIYFVEVTVGEKVFREKVVVE